MSLFDDNTQITETHPAVEQISEGLGFTKPADPPQDAGTTPATAPAAATPASPSPSPAAATPSAPVAATPPTATPPAAATPAPPPQDLATAPKTWKPEVAAAFKDLPEPVRAEIHRREEDFHRGIEGYKGQADFGKAFHTILKPYETVLREYNIDPVTNVQELMRFQHELSLGTEDQKVALIQRLIRDYRVPAAKLGVTAAPAGAPADPPYEDPAVKALRDDLASVKTTLDDNARRQQTALFQQKTQEIEAFRADPSHPDFDLLAEHIVKLMEGKVATSLQHAYDLALWQNPVTRQREIDRKTAEANTKREAEEKEAAERAKAASAANVRSRARSGGVTAPTGTMEDTMRETLVKIKARG